MLGLYLVSAKGGELPAEGEQVRQREAADYDDED